MTRSRPVIFPPGPTTTAVAGGAFLDQPLPFNRLPPQLQGMGTTVIYVDPTNNLHNLAGPLMGLEGTRLATQLYGDQQWPFNQVITNSPYVMGANIHRQNIPERKLNLGIIIGRHNPPMTEYEYRIAEDYWWAGQDETNDGWLGVYTRFSGWRWIPVRPDETVKTPQLMDPSAYGNNASKWDITWMAQRPYFTKPALYKTWEASKSGDPVPPPGAGLIGGLFDQLIGDVYYTGNLPIANRGDMPAYVQYLVSSPGEAILQDNASNRFVPLPVTAAATGTFLVDTEPTNRTLVAAHDPKDNLLFELIRQSQILDFFLSGVANEGIPLQLQFTNRFIYSIPPQTVQQFTVYHSNPGAVITAIVSQRFKRSR